MVTKHTASQCLGLLRDLDVGSPIAEDDNLVYECRVETSTFHGLLKDEIDIVRGTKGSGKTALFRLLTQYLASTLLQDERLAIVRGVEAVGDPIFLKYEEQFSQLSETAFENFWRVYFISLITSQVFNDPRIAILLKAASSEVTDFKRLVRKHGFPMQESKYSLQGLVAWVLTNIPRPKRLEGGMSDTGTPQVALEFAEPRAGSLVSAGAPVFLAPIHDALLRVLNGANLRIWIMLDRLDEVFPRRSEMERTALRALLRCTQAFKDRRIRLKIFLRDDIFDSVTDADGFVALTHIQSRCSDVLKWNREQILRLITNRIFSQQSLLTRHFRVDRGQLEGDPAYRLRCFYEVFPEKLRLGINQSSTFDWIYTHCEDGNGVATPRDVIDLIKLAKSEQMNILGTNQAPVTGVLSPQAILHGHRSMSSAKRINFLKAEFPHFWSAIEKLDGQKAEHDKESLLDLLGEHSGALRDLVSIGVLRYSPRFETYTVPFLYRPALGVKQGKAKRSRPRRRGGAT